MAETQFNLATGRRAKRQLLITVAEWMANSATFTFTGDGTAKTFTIPAKPSVLVGVTVGGTASTDYTYSATTGTITFTTAPVSDAAIVATYSEREREILGTRTEDSSIEYNADIKTSTDIRGINYTDVDKTQPQQDFDPYLILGGSKLGALLNNIRRRNALSELSQFTVYVITAYAGAAGAYETEAHTNCTIAYTKLGGDTNVNMPISVYLSNDYNGSGAPGLGTVDKLSDDFQFTLTTEA
jgi:hypothetical protein